MSRADRIVWTIVLTASIGAMAAGVVYIAFTMGRVVGVE
jgi:hypothetical protein